MNPASQVAANTGSIAAAQVLNKLASTCFVIYVARHFGQYGFGEYAFAFGVMAILCLLADFGLGTLSLRELSRDRRRADAYFTANVIARIGLAGAGILLLQATMPWLRLTPAIREMLNVLQLLLVFQAFTGSYGVVFNAFEVMHYPQFLSVFHTVSVALLGLGLLHLGFRVTALAYLAVTVAGINVGITAFLMRNRVTRLHWRPERHLLLGLLRSSCPFALTSLFALVYFRIGVLFLQFLDGPAAVGSYVAAFKVLEAYLVLPGALTVAMFPILSRRAVEPGRALSDAIRKAVRYLLMAGWPLAIGTLVLADRLLAVLYSDRYLTSAGCLRILALGVIPLFLNAVLGYAAFSLNRERVTMGIAGALIGLSALLNALWIPEYGIRGAAGATLVTQFLSCALYLLLLRRWLPGLQLGRCLWKPLAACAPFSVLLATGPSVLSVGICVLFYGAMLFLLRAFDAGDAVLLRRILHPSEGAP